MNQRLEVVSIDSIKPNPNQPRTDSFDIEELTALAQTIKSVGLIHPPLVLKKEIGGYELIAGERRFRAAKLAGLKEIPVLVQETDAEKSPLAALIENIQRVNLNPIELASALQKLIDEKQMTHDQLSETIGVKRATLSNQLRVLNLPKIIQNALVENHITFGHAKVILSLPEEKQQLSLFQIIIRSKLNVRETEKKAETIKNKNKKTSFSKKLSRNIFLEQISESLQKKMGTRVEFVGNEKNGVIQLHYYSLSDLNRLLHELGYSEE